MAARMAFRGTRAALAAVALLVCLRSASAARELRQASCQWDGCFAGSAGPCKAANTVCYAYFDAPGTIWDGTCPGGTQDCRDNGGGNPSPGPSPPASSPGPAPSPSGCNAAGSWDNCFDSSSGPCRNPSGVGAPQGYCFSSMDDGTCWSGTQHCDEQEGPSPPPATSPNPPGQECVTRAQLIAINEESSFWPRCDPSQADKGTPPAGGYEFGFYCTQAFADALNEVLTGLGYCGDGATTRKFLAQIAYETGYYSTLVQPADDGSGLIHMIPANFRPNAEDMELEFPGQGLLAAYDAAPSKQDFFKDPRYAYKSAAAWFRRTNRVIPGCGLDLFPLSLDEQTRCILGRVNNRDEALTLVSKHIPL